MAASPPGKLATVNTEAHTNTRTGGYIHTFELTAQMSEHNSEMHSKVAVLVSVRVIICFRSRSESRSGLGLG